MFATAIVLLVLAAMANIAKLIFMLKTVKREGSLQVSSIAFGIGVGAFVMEKFAIAVLLFAASILGVLALIARTQPDSSDVRR